MNCVEQGKIEDYLVGNLSSADEKAFEQHCSECSACAEQVVAVGEVVVELDEAKGQEAFDRCFSAVQSELQSGSANGWKILSEKLRIPLRIAAAIIAICTAGVLVTMEADLSSDLQLKVNWKQDGNLLTNLNDRPVVRDGKVFTLRDNDGANQLVALNKSDGSVVWTHPIGKTTRIVADDKRIYTGQLTEGVFTLAAVGVKSGQQEWSYDYEFRSVNRKSFNFQINNGRLNWIVNRTLHSFDTVAGTLLWTRKLSNQKESFALPVADRGNLLVAGSRNLYTVDGMTGEIVGKKKHEQQFTHYLKPQVASTNTKIFVSANSVRGTGKVTCYDKQSGKQLWQKTIDKVKRLQPSHGLLIVKNKKLEAFDQATGELVWSDPIGGCYEVAFHNDNIFAINSTKKHDIVALNAKTGTRIKTFALSGHSCSGLSIDGDDGFLTTNEGTLYAMSF